ncbi:hypothetical protein [Natrinema sp. 1APR25-10V2]|uniref:hypothetical protein n=1 Tax=Natrinema sp. 1APR25-10V2 TaxID=2951081 RepID=UPI002874EB67|nr:hypothetical protein [Natrinema sp. 1APR25-10V2]MDS0473504.1 hypothetical protein [Natrinema sp. 1APR25-10V2]
MTEDIGGSEEISTYTGASSRSDADENGVSAAEFVRERHHISPVHEYVVDHGKSVPRTNVEHTCLEGRDIALSQDVTDDERELIAEGIRATKPQRKACFANAIQLWEYDHRFTYAEGFAVPPGFDIAIEHAWCFLNDEKLVDVTAEFNNYFGAVISDKETLIRYTKDDEIGYGIIGNHHNHFEFLRERGYVQK